MVTAPTPPMYLYKLNPDSCAAALVTAIETPNIAFAPSFDLLAVLSIRIICVSIAF